MKEQRHPLFFVFPLVIYHERFVAGVLACGRALLVQGSDGAWWMDGTQPNGLTQAGATPEEAYRHFRLRLTQVLEDLRDASSGYSDFEQHILDFLRQTDSSSQSEWQGARDAIRGGAEIQDGFVLGLPRVTDDQPRANLVVELDGDRSVSRPQAAFPSPATTVELARAA